MALGLFLRTLVRERNFRRLLARAPEISDSRALGLLEACRQELRIAAPVRAVCTELVRAPAVTGLRHPTLLLPERVIANFNDVELRLVFLHELTHVRRRDILLNAVLAGLRCLYWFHPLAPLAFARLEGARESLRDYETLATERALR